MGTVTPHPSIAGGPRLRAPEPLSGDHDASSFDCGNGDLNKWLQERARTAEGLTARTYVVPQGSRVVGYYCLAAGSVTRSDLPRKLRHDTPEQIPILLIGRLAVDVSFQGHGIGRGLLKDAVLRCLTISGAVGARAIVVHAIDDERAIRFYPKYGFVACPLNARTFILPIEAARASLPS